MKEEYFTKDNVEEQASSMLTEVRSLLRDRGKAFIPDCSALIVVDMQEYFLSSNSHAFVPSAPAIVPAVRMLMEAFRNARRPTILTRHVNSDGDAGMMATWWGELIEKRNPMSRIADDLDISESTVLEKAQYDAFYQTPLESILRSQQIRQTVICGVTANLCCETTARSAFIHGYEVFFVVDGAAAYNADMHRATLLNLAHGFGSLVLARQLLDVFEANRER
jgi:isochorismate hydrolase